MSAEKMNLKLRQRDMIAESERLLLVAYDALKTTRIFPEPSCFNTAWCGM